MNRDLSLEEHRTNPTGSRSGSDGGNALSPGGSLGDEESGPDFVVEVLKVESEFVDDSTSEDKDFDRKLKVDPELIDRPIKGEAPLMKIETFQSNSLQCSQNALSNEHVKQEPCDPPVEPSKADQLLEVNQMKLVSCSNCSQLFCSEVFNRHMTQTLDEETDTFSSASYNRSCKSCTETLKNTQGSERPYNCSVCKKSFTMLSSLKRHRSIHTGEKPYKCSVCHKAFVRSSHLHEHQRTHTGEKPHKCSVCNKNFSSSYLGEHKKLHSREKPYKCSVCSKDFVSSSHLHQHEKIHTGEKPHKCSVCLKAFVCSWHLHEHQRIHTGEKPYKCSVCFKTFRHFNSLKVHQRTHTGEQPYKCSVCNKDFVYSSTMKRHERIHTREKISPHADTGLHTEAKPSRDNT